MKKLLQPCLLMLFAQVSVLAQICNWNNICNHPPIVTYNPSGASVGQVGNYGAGANCHGFAKRYFEQNYTILNAKSPTSSDGNVTTYLNDMASAPFIDAGPFSSHVQILGTSSSYESQADGVFYYTAGVITHSAIKIGKAFGNGSYGPQLYLSKFEPCGPVVQHTLTDIGYYTDNCIVNPTIKYFKWVGTPGGCSSTGLTLSSTSIGNNQIRVSAPSGWNSYQWSVSSNGSYTNNGSSIDVSRTSNSPTNITVTLTANKDGCTGTDTETITINPPPLVNNCNLAPAPVISSNNICSSCSCAAYDGTFLVRAPFGWSNHQWTISAAGMIVWDLGEYIYIDRNPNHSGWPNNDIVVTLTATKNGCTKSYTTPPINLPSNCSGGGGPGFGFSVNSENELEITVDEEVMEEETGPVMEFSVYDMSGNSLGSTRTSEKKFIISLTERMGQGPYILRLQKEGKLYTRKVYFLKEEN